MPPQMGTRSWLRGLPLRASSLWWPLYMLSLRNFFFLRNFFLQRIFLFPPKNKLSSQRVLQLLPYKASPIRTSTCTTSPLSSPLFALCVRYVVFEEEKELPWGHHLGSQLPQRPTGGLLVSWGCWYLPGGVKMTCNKFLQNRPKNRRKLSSAAKQ